MQGAAEICLFSSEPESMSTLQGHLEEFRFCAVAGRIDTWEKLRDLLNTGRIEAVVINLDNGEEQHLDTVSRIAHGWKQVNIVGISRRTDAQGIIAPMRAGCSQMVTAPVDPTDLRDALQRVLAGRMTTPQEESKRICVVGASGGVGATTVVCNLAIELARVTESRSAIVDLNLEYGDTCCAFDCEPTYSISDICRDGVDIDPEIINKALHPLPCDVSLLATPRNIMDAREVSPEGIEAMLAVLGRMYPYTIIDLPRAYSFLTAAALDGTDHILLVSQLSVPIIRNTERVYSYLVEMGVDEERIEIVVNRTQASFQQVALEDVEAHFKRPVFASIPNDYRRLRLSLDLGHPLNKNAAEGPARIAINKLARTLAGAMPNDQNTTTSSKGLFSRIWR